MRNSIKDSRWLNWRVAPHLCIRIMPGLWFPAIYNRREKKYFAVVLPFVGISFDYE